MTAQSSQAEEGRRGLRIRLKEFQRHPPAWTYRVPRWRNLDMIEITAMQNFTDAERQIRVMDCDKYRLWLTLSFWTRNLIQTLKGTEHETGEEWYRRQPTIPGIKPAHFYKYGPKDWLAGKAIPFTSKKDYLALAGHVIRSWRDQQPLQNHIIRSKILFAEDDQIGKESLERSLQVSVSYAVTSLREAFGTFKKNAPLPPRLSDIDPTVKIIAHQILKGECKDHPVLADAAEESGYTFTPVLDHLRKGPHGDGPCWAVLSLLNLHPLLHPSEKKPVAVRPATNRYPMAGYSPTPPT